MNISTIGLDIDEFLDRENPTLHLYDFLLREGNRDLAQSFLAIYANYLSGLPLVEVMRIVAKELVILRANLPLDGTFPEYLPGELQKFLLSCWPKIGSGEVHESRAVFWIQRYFGEKMMAALLDPNNQNEAHDTEGEQPIAAVNSDEPRASLPPADHAKFAG